MKPWQIETNLLNHADKADFILNNFADILRDTSSGIPLVYDKGGLIFGSPTIK